VRGRVGAGYAPPRCCAACGALFPWTAGKLSAAQGLVDALDQLGEDERSKLKEYMEEIVRGTAQKEAAAQHFRRLVGKAGAGMAEPFKELLQNSVGEATRKLMFGGSRTS